MMLYKNTKQLCVDTRCNLGDQPGAIKSSGKRESGKSMLAARFDNDIYIYIYIYTGKADQSKHTPGKRNNNPCINPPDQPKIIYTGNK